MLTTTRAPPSRLLPTNTHTNTHTHTRSICALHALYNECHFTYLEINPLVVLDSGDVVPLDMAAKIDETAAFLVRVWWWWRWR